MRGCIGPRRLTEKPDGMKVTVQAVATPTAPGPHQAEPDNTVHGVLRERIEQLDEVKGKCDKLWAPPMPAISPFVVKLSYKLSLGRSL